MAALYHPVENLLTTPERLGKTCLTGELNIRVSESLRCYDPRAMVWWLPWNPGILALLCWEESLFSGSYFPACQTEVTKPAPQIRAGFKRPG